MKKSWNVDPILERHSKAELKPGCSYSIPYSIHNTKKLLKGKICSSKQEV